MVTKLYFSKHYKSMLIVMKYYTNLYDNKEGNERLIKNMNHCIYFRKNSYYDANFGATNFVSMDQIGISICLNYKNTNIRKKSASHFPMKVSHMLAK